MKTVRVNSFDIGSTERPVLIAGPCVIESETHTLKMAGLIAEIAAKHDVHCIFKSSFDKANRSSIHSYRGPGLLKGLQILQDVKETIGLPVLTDIHDVSQIGPASDIADVIQIPAFLCRQTDLYVEAGKFDVVLNIKKGQFMSPADMKNAVEKAHHSGVQKVLVTERGVSFGYNRLIVDFLSLPLMRALGVPVVFDVTHSLQLPGAGGTYTGGNRDFAPHLARAAVAVGVDALFLEVHDNPEKALSDGSNMITPDTLDSLLTEVIAINQVLKSNGAV
jgi:2-dehydro-3-deoxyphosphooctonate aldolase (KDO 8-P synthase)